jgi:hypothetical protein
MPWPLYRDMMLGQISPWAAGAANDPGGAFDAAPRWLGRDQEAPQTRTGKINGPYLRATSEYLKNAGVDAEIINQIMEMLNEFAEPENGNGDQENPTRAEMEEGRAGLMPLLARGAQDSARRKLAYDYDSYGNKRPRRQPMSSRQKADLERRFPGISRIGHA